MSEQASTGRVPVRVLAILLLLYALAFMDRQIVALLVGPIKHDLGISDLQFSFVQGGAFVTFFAIFSLPVGWAVDRYSRRLIIFFGVVTWSLATIACGLARNLDQLLLARCLVGAGEAALAPAAYSLLADLAPRHRLATTLATFSLGSVLGAGLALIGGGYLVLLSEQIAQQPLPGLGSLLSWQIVFLLVGAPGMLLAFLIFLVPEPKVRSATGLAISLEELAHHLHCHWRFYTSHIIGFGVMNIMAAGYVAWAPTLLIREWGWSAWDTGLFLGLASLIAGGSGMLISGRVCDALFHRGVTDAHLRYYVVAALVFGCAGLALCLARSAVLLFAGIIVVQFILTYIAVAAAALQLPTPSRLRGKVSALFLFVYNLIGYGLGPSAMAAVSDLAGGIRVGMGVIFLLCAPIAAGIFYLGLAPMRRAVAAAINARA